MFPQLAVSSFSSFLREPRRRVRADLMQDGCQVVTGPLLDDLSVRKAVDVDCVPPHLATGRRDPKKIPLVGRLDDVAHGDGVARCDYVLLRRVQVGQRAYE